VRKIYLQGAANFTMPKGHTAIKVYCSLHNRGAAELVNELNETFEGTRRTWRSTGSQKYRMSSFIQRGSKGLLLVRSSSIKKQLADALSNEPSSTRRSTDSGPATSASVSLTERSSDDRRGAPSRSQITFSQRETEPAREGSAAGRPRSSDMVQEVARTTDQRQQNGSRLLQVVDRVEECDHMLIYLNAHTWTESPEELGGDIGRAQRLGVHLQPCHEFPSVLDPDSLRAAVDFKTIMDATPRSLKRSRSNIYSQIAIALKGGELRDVGLAVLAGRLMERVPRTPILDEPDERMTRVPSFNPSSQSWVSSLAPTKSSSASCAKLKQIFSSAMKSSEISAIDPPIDRSSNDVELKPSLLPGVAAHSSAKALVAHADATKIAVTIESGV